MNYVKIVNYVYHFQTQEKKKMFISLLYSKFSIFLIYSVLTLIQITPCSTPQLLSKKKEKNLYQCCAFPCLHGGVCVERKFRYTCDCQNTGYYGKHCAIETWMTFLSVCITSLLEIIISIHYAFCSLFGINSLYFPSYNKMVEDSFSQMHNVGIYDLNGEPYITLNPVYSNYDAVRLTSSVPHYCPTPLGIQGKRNFNSVSEVYNCLLKRTNFYPSKTVNLLFTIYGFHFLLQYLDHGNLHGVTCSQIYTEHSRMFFKGKLLTEVFNEEEYPLHQRKIYKKAFTYNLGKSDQADWKISLLKQNSLTYAMATLWVREHNRICDILAKLWPSWDDNRLFETARNIVTGEVLVITLSEWYPVLMDYKANLFYDPSYSQSGYTLFYNRLPIEALLAFHWPNLIPDSFLLKNYTVYLTESFMNNQDENVVKHFGLYDVIKALASTHSGRGNIQNAAKSLSKTTKYVIEIGRKLRIPSFNRMRTILGLKPYNNFAEIVKNEKWEPILKKNYENVEGLEFTTGMLIESNIKQNNVIGETARTMIGPWLFKALLTHPLGSKSMWRPSTMGGKVGWDIVNKAKLKNLICQNVKSPETCYKENLISFRLKPKRRKRKTSRCERPKCREVTNTK